MADPTNINNEITLDFQRAERIGMSEAVYCQHKSVDQLASVIEQLRENKRAMLFTR